MFYGFDLDGTVICSKHRKSTLPDGTLDLAHWIENNTPEKIACDSLLPMIKMMRLAWKNGDHILIVTARVLSDADFEFFMANDIPYHDILSRPMGCTMADSELKDIQLRLYAQGLNKSWAAFCSQFRYFDDADSVLQHLSDIGVDCQNAKTINRLMVAA